MVNKIMALVVAVLFTAIAAAQSKRLLAGGTAGYQSSVFELRGGDFNGVANGAWRAALVADYALTSRLSLQGQLGVQHINAASLTSNGRNELTYPELWLGATEYLPAGGGSFFLTASVTAGIGLAGNQLFEQDGYNRNRLGMSFMLGYIFRPGIFINTGLQVNSFTSFYTVPGTTQKYFENSFHVLSAGYLFSYGKRLRPHRNR